MKKLSSIFILLFSVISMAFAQQQSVKLKGTVKGNEGAEILKEITISVKGKELPIKINEKGEYSIQVQEGNHTIKFSAPGYKTKTVFIEVYSDTELNMELEKIKNSPTSRA